METSIMETPIVVGALITAFSVIISAVVAAIVSSLISRRALRHEVEQRAIDYFTRKIEILQKNKLLLIEQDSKQSNQSNDLEAEMIATTYEAYLCSKRVFRSIKQYFSTNAVKDLERRSDKIKESIAYKRMEKSGLISYSNFNDTHKEILNIVDVIREMGSFADDLEALIDEELRSSIERIEKYSTVVT